MEVGYSLFPWRYSWYGMVLPDALMIVILFNCICSEDSWQL